VVLCDPCDCQSVTYGLAGLTAQAQAVTCCIVAHLTGPFVALHMRHTRPILGAGGHACDHVTRAVLCAGWRGWGSWWGTPSLGRWPLR
jgi:hypothetical protein